MRRIVGLAGLLVTVCAVSPLGWGEEGHRLIAKAALQQRPKQVPSFLRKAGDREGRGSGECPLFRRRIPSVHATHQDVHTVRVLRAG
jgi:hypothetical protein